MIRKSVNLRRRRLGLAAALAGRIHSAIPGSVERYCEVLLSEFA
jgi:hypothetical protein